MSHDTPRGPTGPDEPEDALPAELADLIADLPMEVEPEVDLWAGIREQIAPVPVQTGASAPSRSSVPAGTGSRRATLWMAGLLAAAAVVLVARAVMPGAPGIEPNPVVATVAAPSLGDPQLDAWESEVRQTTDDLLAMLDERRSELDPEAIEVVEKALVDIDSAIADVRGALASDPGNDRLVDALAGVYERKVHLLRTMTELPSADGPERRGG
jgi:hypothetical protein